MRRILMAMLVAFAAVFVGAVPAQAAGGFTVSGGKIYDANGNLFVPQGVNHAHAWYPSQTSSIAAIREAGANTVRVVLSGGRWGTNSASDVANIIDLCKRNQLVCMLENHDTTGYGEDGAARSLSAAAQYWVGIASVLRGQEAYVMINIGNEPFGNSGYQNWASDTVAAINTLRSAGLSHTLVVDAPNWGQDWSNTMRDNAGTVAAADGNTVFSVHMYGVYNTASKVRAYLDSFTSRGLPILVGEFGDNHSDGDPDEATILSHTRGQGIGVLGWSWSGNGSGVEYLDMVNGFSATSLTPWGQRFINGTDGLKARAPQVASVYTNGNNGNDGNDGNDGGTAPNGYPYCSSASADPDGDGWGWENSASCVVRGSSADTGSGNGNNGNNGGNDGNSTAPNGYPYCSSASADPDGDGWGWENSASCVVRGSSADTGSGGGNGNSTAPNGYPYCSSASADPDGDGWGWENSASCVVRGSQADA
ncbi:cellulase family glycosylhydrolase [Actinocorallia sp. API 0066]|uniref:cellulase family glycosylhydrolase n=1 Tax=Actinocorallia sp. API 0066 TaxID=2896846 RepID=UPI001E5F51BB|nr:cellulase family glycosylhydrolase [Actinocorallia sp. API 0066]MCD0451142.1 cellulase family glycosylhydrolase [Actinocorallia sp. API 0066]